MPSSGFIVSVSSGEMPMCVTPEACAGGGGGGAGFFKKIFIIYFGCIGSSLQTVVCGLGCPAACGISAPPQGI